MLDFFSCYCFCDAKIRNGQGGGGMGNVFVRVRTTSMFAFRLAYVGFVCMIVMSGKERNKH